MAIKIAVAKSIALYRERPVGEESGDRKRPRAGALAIRPFAVSRQRSLMAIESGWSPSVSPG
jgi:hypothetical protein